MTDDEILEDEELDDEEDSATGEEKDSEDTNAHDKQESQSKRQSSKENARFKQMRLEQEQKQRERESYVKGKIDALKKNEFTNTPIKTQEDLEIYEIQKELEEKGLDPLADLAPEIARRQTDARLKAEQEVKEKSELDLRVQKDLEDFYEQGYTKEDMDNFLSEMSKPEWKDMFGDAIETGHISPAKAYKAMKKIRNDVASETKIKEESKKKSVPPIPQGSQKQSKSIKEMTAEEIDKLYNERFRKGI